QRALEYGVAVRRAFGDQIGADVAAGARPIVDDNRLAPCLGQLLADRAGHDVERTAGGERDDETNRLRRVGLLRGQHRERQKDRQRYANSATANPSDFHPAFPLSRRRRPTLDSINKPCADSPRGALAACRSYGVSRRVGVPAAARRDAIWLEMSSSTWGRSKPPPSSISHSRSNPVTKTQVSSAALAGDRSLRIAPVSLARA